jgi:hypothetical protein
VSSALSYCRRPTAICMTPLGASAAVPKRCRSRACNRARRIGAGVRTKTTRSNASAIDPIQLSHEPEKPNAMTSQSLCSAFQRPLAPATKIEAVENRP